MAKQNSDNASWLRPLPEEFTRNGMSPKRRNILTSVTVLVLAAFSILIWMSYTSDGEDLGPVPVVRADGAAVKVKPDEPGGKEIPFQNTEVFTRVDNLPNEEENVIASSSEIPMKRPVAEEPVAQIEEETSLKVAEEIEQVAPAAAAPPPPVKMPTLAVTKTVGNFMIQIGAFAEKSKAENLWQAAKQKNSTVLASLSPTYMRVDLGAKGVLYRVRGGMLETRKAADAVCASLKKNNQGCMVVSK